MFAKIQAAGRALRGLAEFCFLAATLLTILAVVLAISGWILSVGIGDYGLLAGILIAIPFLFVVWIGGLYVAGLIRRAVWP